MEPHIEVKKEEEQYLVRLTPPNGTQLRDAAVSLVGSRSFQLSGTIEPSTSTQQVFYTYQVQRRAAVYAEPHRRANIGSLAPGTVVQGSAPSSRGWIALDDDESFMLDDGALVVVARPRRHHHSLVKHPEQFDRRINLPVDALVDQSIAKTLQDGSGLLLTVPRHLVEPVATPVQQRTVRARASPGVVAPRTLHSTHQDYAPHAPQIWKKHHEKEPKVEQHFGGATQTVQTTPPAPATPQATPSKVSQAKAVPIGKSLHDELRMKLSPESEPLLVEVAASVLNVSSPVEAPLESWVAIPGGGFARGE